MVRYPVDCYISYLAEHYQLQASKQVLYVLRSWYIHMPVQNADARSWKSVLHTNTHARYTYCSDDKTRLILKTAVCP